MADGEDLGRQPASGSHNLLAQVNEASMYFGNNLHEPIVRHVAELAAAELSTLLDWANQSAAKSGWHLTLSLLDRLEFGASVAAYSSAKRASISISLGCVRRLIGAANKLAQVEFFPPMTRPTITEEAFCEWSDTEPIGMLMVGHRVTDRTYRTAIDAMVLLFLHEVGHTFCQHFLWNLADDEVARAAETEADAMAGFMFGGWQSTRAGGHRSKVERAVRASEALHVWLQASPKRSARYHLPPNRVECITHGVVKSRIGGRRADEWVNNQRYLLADYYMYAPEAFASWRTHADPSVVSDRHQLQRQSFPLFRRLARESLGRRCLRTIL